MVPAVASVLARAAATCRPTFGAIPARTGNDPCEPSGGRSAGRNPPDGAASAASHPPGRLGPAAGIGVERGPRPGPARLGAPARARAVGAEPGSGATGHVKPSVAPCRPEAPRNPPPGAPAATDRDATARAVMSRGERA